MSKHISAGDTLTVGDLTDDHLGAVIEVGPTDGGITCRFRLDRIECYGTSQVKMLTTEGGAKHADLGERVKIIAPPPVVQPDEPKELGQCIRIEGVPLFFAVVLDLGSPDPFRTNTGFWRDWEHILSRAGNRQIIVSDPPRWPDETPAVPERIEEGEWPDDDTHLREWEWIGHLDYRWRWYAEETRKSGWAWTPDAVRRHNPIRGPWTRGERIQ